MIKFEEVFYQYPNGLLALNNLNFEIHQGEFVAFIGQNGAGKTTLLKHFNGMLQPTSGQVIIGGSNTKMVTTGMLARRIGYLFQNPDHQIFLPTVEQELSFGPSNLGVSREEIRQRINRVSELVGLTPYLKDNPMLLSKGLRQRVALASVLSMEPEVLVLDEPTTGQDYQESLRIMELMQDLHGQGHTIILVTHDMELVAKSAKRVIVLNEGQILMDDSCPNVFYQPELLHRTNLLPAQIPQLAQRFGVNQLPFGKVISVEELYQQVMKVAGGEGNVCCG